MISNTIKLSILFVVLLLVQNVNLTMNKNLKAKIYVSNDYTIVNDPNTVSQNSLFLIKNPYTDMCLFWTKDNSVQQDRCDKNQTNQAWRILKDGKSVKFSNIEGKLLEYRSGNANKGKRYGISKPNNSESQKFLVEKFSYGHSIQNIQSQGEKCMVPKKLDVKTKMTSIRCMATLRIAWRLEKSDVVLPK